MNYTASDVRKRRIERGSGNTSSSSGGVTADDVKSRRMSRQFGFDTLGADEAKVRSLISNTYGNWQDKDTLNANYAQVQGIANRLNAFKQYNGQNVKSQTDLDKIINYYNGALENWDAMAQTYGNFVNADAYNAAVKKSDLQKKYAGKSYEQIQQALGKAEDKDEYNYLLRYTDYANKEDIEKAIAGTQNADYKKALTAVSEQYDREHAFDKYADILNAPDYAVSDGEDARKAISNLSAFMKAGGNTGDTSFSDVFNALNEDERSVAGYIYKKEGIDGVMNYLRDMQFYAGKRKYNEELENATEGINNNNWKAFGQTVGNALTNIVSLPYVATEELDAFLTGGQYNPYIGASGAYNFSQDTTQAVAQKIADNTNWEIAGENVPAFLYNVAMSNVNSRLGQILTGQAFTILMGAGAFSSTYKEALERGLDSDNAAWTALTAGISESLFEYVSFEQFKALQASGNVKGIRDIVANFAKQFFTEGSEEVATDIANRLSDDIINGSLSEYNSRKQAYIDAGYSKEEAEKNANAEFGKQLAESFIAGGLAGGASSGVASILSYANNMKTGHNADMDMLKAYAEANGQGELLEQADTNALVGAFINGMREESRGFGEWNQTETTAFRENAEKLGGSKREAYEASYKGQDAEGYDFAFRAVWDGALNGRTLTEMKLMFHGDSLLNNNDIEKIYSAASKIRIEEGAQRVEARKAVLNSIEKKFVAGKFETTLNEADLAPKKRVGFNIAKVFSLLGINVRVVDDYETRKNGFFNRDGDYLQINLSARYAHSDAATGQFVASTIAHEITHNAEYRNNEGYKALREAIAQVYGDAKFTDLIYKRMQAENLTREKAESEVIARACEDMLNDSKTMRELLSRMNEREINSFRDLIMSIIDKISSAWDEMMEGFTSNSAEAKELRKAFAEDKEGFEKLRTQWVDMIADSLKSAQVENVVNEVAEDYTAKGNEVEQFSMQADIETDGKLVAYHNLSEDNLLKTIKMGGFIMPSIAIKRFGSAHTDYGDITAIFSRDTVNPRNTYSADAWTTTFPAIDKKVSEKVQKKVYDRIVELIGGRDKYNLLGNPSLDYDNMSDKIGRRGDAVDAYKDEKAVKYAYLQDIGEGFEIPTKDKNFSSMLSNDSLGAIALTIGKEKLDEMNNGGYSWFSEHPEEVDLLRQRLNEAYYREHESEVSAQKLDTALGRKLYKEHFNGEDGKITFNNYHNMLMAMIGLSRDSREQVLDREAFDEKLANIDNAKYTEWLENLFDGIIEKEGVRNNADYFTPSGNRRSWEALHYPATAENILKVMKMQEKQGAAGFFDAQNIWGIATHNYQNIDEMRADASRLIRDDYTEYEELRSKYTERLQEIASDIMDKRESNNFIAYDRTASAIVDSLRGRKTVASINKRLSEYSALNIKSHTAQDILDLYNDIMAMPTPYFENKEPRVVGLDEIEQLVIPSNASKKLIEALKANNIPYTTYEYSDTDTTDRVEKTNEVAKDIMFSEQVEAGSENYTLDDNGLVVISEEQFVPHDFDKRIKDTKQKIYDYLMQLEGQEVSIGTDGRLVLFDEAGAWEYEHSKSFTNLHPYKKKAKTEATRAIKQIVETAYYNRWRENTETNPKKKDSARGMLHYNILFGVPEKGRIAYYSGEILIRQSSDGRDYFYDVVDIKKEGSHSELTDEQLASVGILPRGESEVNKELKNGQKKTSEGTSQKQNASTFNTYQFKEGERVLDWGGGKWDISRMVVKASYDDVTIESVDEFNRTSEHNSRVLNEFKNNKATSLTINNVLNVIDSNKAIDSLLFESKKYLKPNGICYIHIYTGNGSGVGKETSAGYQRNEKAPAYESMVRKYYKNVKVSGDFILASDGAINVKKLDDIHKERIKQNNANVNMISNEYLDVKNALYSKQADSDGNALSEKQVELFKDSKMRDELGRLKVFYHGSRNDFTVFDINKASSMGHFGRGFYFADTALAGYGNKVYKCYLNIENPISYKDTDSSFTDEQLRKYITAIAENEDYGIENYGYGYTVDDLVEDFSGQDRYYVINDLNATCIGDFVAAVKLFNEVNGTNFDGIEAASETVAFYPEQIKLTTNENPTSNPDMRYSTQVDDEAYNLMGETDRLAKDNQKLRKDVERLTEALRLSKTVTEGKVLKKSQVEAAARTIRRMANSTYDVDVLTNELTDVYSYILDNANDENKVVDWDVLMGMAYDVAGRVLHESKGAKYVDAHYKAMLNDFRKTRVSLSDEQIQEARNVYGDTYRNEFMGSIILAKNATPLDSMWQEWSAQYPELFDADTNPNDMPTALLDAIDTIRESATVYESFETQEMTTQLAYEIYNKFWNVDTVRTYADRALAQHRKAMAELKASYEERLARRLAQQKLKDNNSKAEMLRKVREQRDRRFEEFKEFKKKQAIDAKEAQAKRTMIRKIIDTSAELNKWLTTNSKDKHVPEALKVPLANLLDAIDFSSKQMYNTGVPTRRDVSLLNAMEKMHTMIMQESKALTSEDGVTELDLTSDFADSVDELYKAINRVERQVREDNGYILQAMSSSELSDLYDMIKVMKHSITQMNHMISSTNAHRMDAVATKAIDYAKELGQTKMPEAVRRYDFGEALPYYTFKRMGEGGKIVFENFMDGQDKMAFHARTIKDYADSVYTAKQVNEWEKDIKEFTIGDKTFEITVPQIMSLYCLSKREQARQHILQGGIRVDEFKKGFKKVNQVENVNLSAADLSNIIGTLTDEQREVADKLQEFMNTVCSDWGNEVTMKRFGIKGFTEKNYFPIRSDENNLKSDTKDRQNSLYALLNMSFTKGLTANANNQIIVSDVFDVFAKHSSDMARYNALSLPVLDLIRWWNYKVRTENENGFSDVTVKGALENAFGREMNSYIRRFIDDVNGTKEKGRMDSLSSKMLTAYKIAAVGANIQVALLQPISYIRAAYVIDKKYLTQGLTRKPNTTDAKQYVGMMVWKDMGFFEPDVTNGLQDIIKHADTAADKIKELSMKGAELGDTLTWGFLWNACEAEVADKQRNLVRGSEEFKKAVAKRMREVIYSTQVVDSVFTRSQYMRGGDMYTKMLTAFLAEPTLSLNVLRDAYEGYAQDVKRYGKGEAWKRNGRNISMAFGTYITCAVVESALRGAIGKVRNPEDDEEIGKLIMDNLKNELNPMGKLPYFKDIIELMEGYSPTRMDESVIQQGIWTYKAIAKGEWDYSTWYKIFKFASQVSGLPLSNAMREATTIWNASVGSFYPSIRIE